MVILQLSAVYLVIILGALVLAFFSILANSFIHVSNSVGVVDKGGILGVWISCNAFMSGSL